MDEVRGFSKTISRLLAGFQRRFFVDADGNRWEFAGRPTGTATGGSAFAWDLAKDGSSFYIPKPGRIHTSYTQADSAVTVAEVAASFALEPGHLVYLKLTTPATPVFTLMAGEPPEGWPQTVKYAESPDPPRVEEAYFILHEAIEGTLPANEWGRQFGSFYTKRTERSIDSMLIWGGEELDNNFQQVPVPVLVSL